MATVIEDDRQTERLEVTPQVPPAPVTAVVAAGKRLVRDMLSEGLEVDGDIRVLATGRDAAETLAEVERRGPAVVVICDDIGVDERSKATEALASVIDGPMIVHVVERATVTDLADAIESGARGYVPRDAGLVGLRSAVVSVARRRVAMPDELIGPLLDRLVERRVVAKERDARLSTLSAREREVLALLADGASSDRIAAELTISKGTARKHVQNILVKMGIRSRLEAVAYVLKGGRRALLSSDD